MSALQSSAIFLSIHITLFIYIYIYILITIIIYIRFRIRKPMVFTRRTIGFPFG